MKLTGEMLYDVMKPDGSNDWCLLSEITRTSWIAVAAKLNVQLSKHDTQPLVDHRPYRRQLNVFSALGIEDDPFAEVEQSVNEWFNAHPDAIIISLTPTSSVSARGEDLYTVSLLVELPVAEAE